MKYAHALTCLAGLFQAAAGLPSMVAETRQTTCTSPRLRKSWTAATSTEKKAYIDAALCLTKKTSKLGLTGATIHDDFAWVHNKLSNQIHSVAAFLPWHRYFIRVYENALKTECGYTGTALYWDWVADAAAPSLASVWDPVTGFGGNGTGIANTKFSFCVNDGPFANLQLRFWSNDTVTHCLQRQFTDAIPQAGLQEMLGFNYDQRAVDSVLATTPYLTFHGQLEGGPHASVHGGVGGSFGDMGPLTSPNGKLLVLFHRYILNQYLQILSSSYTTPKLTESGGSGSNRIHLASSTMLATSGPKTPLEEVLHWMILCLWGDSRQTGRSVTL